MPEFICQEQQQQQQQQQDAELPSGPSSSDCRAVHYETSSGCWQLVEWDGECFQVGLLGWRVRSAQPACRSSC
jgi:hypothetical protein